MKFPPEDVTCSVAGVVETLKTIDIDCGDVCEFAVKVCCAAAPVKAVPFNVNCKVLVIGKELPLLGEQVPE